MMKELCCLILLVCVYSVQCVYHCGRPGAVCDGVCGADGSCTSCVAGQGGYDCSVVTAEIDGGTCAADTCKNGGTCWNDAGTPTCLCTERWTGATCEDKRYELTCNANDMDITVRPDVGTFSGVVSVEGKVDDAACKVEADPFTFTALTFVNADCGDTTNEGTGADTTYKRYIIVRYQTGMLMGWDERVTFICGGGDTVDKIAPVVTVVGNGVTDISEGDAPIDTHVDFVIKDGDTAVAGEVDLTKVLTVEASLSADGIAVGFTAVRYVDCSASSGTDAAAAGYASETFFTASCPADLKGIMSNYLQPANKNSFDFRVFKFDASTEIHITCTIKVCKTATDCDPTDCGGETGNGFGRKKRETDTSVNKVLSRTLTVNDPLLAAAKTIQEFKESKACYQTWEMTATVVALAVALVIVLLICIILIVKNIVNRRRGSTYREDVSETASTAHFPHLPTIVSNKA